MIAKTKTHHTKRHGLHQKRTKRFHSVYLPYLPALLITLTSILLSGYAPPHRATLAYATNVSISGLLQSTNAQRRANGQPELSLNQQLVGAAQAKATDMIARNYWSHNTPDGQEPWVFFTNAGYQYQKAGENLAYGFGSSDDTVTGWMNSPPHKANLLDAAFTEVGFGFANGSNFNNDGQETVVVAEYGEPQVLAASNTTTPVQTAQPTTPVAQPPAAPILAPAPVADTPIPQSITPTTPTKEIAAIPVTTAAPKDYEPQTVAVTRLQAMLGNKAVLASFVVGLLSAGAVIALLIKHLYGVRHLFTVSQRFVLHHPLFDSTAISLVILGATLLRTIGTIR